MRVWIAALGALLLALAPSARAQTRALAPAEHQGGPALAGDRVYWASSSQGTLTVRSAPAAGGEDATVGTVAVRKGVPAAWNLSAAPEGLALRLTDRLLIGGLAGPLATLARTGPDRARMADDPVLWVTAAGTVTLERRGAVLRGGPGDGRVLALPAGADAGRFAAAGNLGAAVTRDAAVVLDLRTGAEVRRLALDGPVVIGIGLSPAGDLAITAELEDGSDVLLWAPAGADEFTVVAHEDRYGLVATAGGRIAMAAPTAGRTGTRVVVLEPVPGGEPRVLYRGPAAAAIDSLAFDGGTVGFSSRGCQLVARVDPASSRLTVPEGPCARTEGWVTISDPTPGGTYRLHVACLTAPAKRCRIDVRVRTFDGRLVGRAAGRPRRGAGMKFRIPLDARGRAAARKDPPELFLTVRATDPDGRVSTVYDSIG